MTVGVVAEAKVPLCEAKVMTWKDCAWPGAHPFVNPTLSAPPSVAAPLTFTCPKVRGDGE